MLGFVALAILASLVLGSSQLLQPAGQRGGSPVTATWADELARLRVRDPAFARNVDEGLRTGNPYYLAQYAPLLTQQGYNYPALASYIAGLVQQNAQHVHAASGRSWRNWGFVPTAPVYFDRPDQRLRVGVGEPIVYVLTEEANPRAVLVYMQSAADKTRKLAAIAPGLSINSPSVREALTDFNVVDTSFYASPGTATETYGNRWQDI